ncbi:MAG: hypothetical protein RLY82_828, partial [Pseudomonadota bacterium]
VLKSFGIEDPSWKDLVQLLDAALLLLLLAAVAVYAIRGRVASDPWLLLLQAIRDMASQQGAQITMHATLREISANLVKPTAYQKQWLADLEVVRYAPPSAQKTDLATLKRQFKKLFPRKP